MNAPHRPRPRVYLQAWEPDYRLLVGNGLAQVGFFAEVPAGATVFLKPNLTFPVYRPGVMTSYDCLKATTDLLRSRGYQVVIGEADSGGYNRFSMDEVFRAMGIYELAQQSGARVVNLSFTEPEFVQVPVGRKRLSVPLPKLLLHEVDACITMPVPKIHMNALVALSIKNQWGCIQNPQDRLRLHPHFAEVIRAVSERLPRPYSVMDGRYGLNRSGPMSGEVVALNWLLVANDLVAADRVACRLMQIEENRVSYLRHFRDQGWWTPFEEIELNERWEGFLRERFYLRRAWTDLPGLACFRSSVLAWLGYQSPVAGVLHWLLYLFRKPFYDYEGERKRVRT
jgi:uncharacterized protein (DUF362 family)